MRKLNDFQHHVLSVVAQRGSICIGTPVSAEWAPIADTLHQLAKWRYLVEDGTDDGPAYSIRERV